jgi:hypothetical protein
MVNTSTNVNKWPLYQIILQNIFPNFIPPSEAPEFTPVLVGFMLHEQ